MRTFIRRFVFTLVVLATLIVLFYAEEDWRGARNFEAAKKAYAAAGESYDYARFVPPPIPDSENFAALPLFHLEWVDPPNPILHGRTRSLLPVGLEKAFHAEASIADSFKVGSYQRGKLADMPEIRRIVGEYYAKLFKGTKASASMLAQWDAVFPFLGELRTASVNRSLCRFDVDYNSYPPVTERMTLVTDQVYLARLLAVDGVLSLEESQPDRALADLRVLYIITSGLQRDPELVSALVGIAVCAYSESIIMEGLARHAWSDAQLAQLQERLRRIDFLKSFQFSMRSEIALDMMLYGYALDAAGKNRSSFAKLPLWPSGWLDENAAELLLFDLRILKTADAQKHDVYPEKVSALTAEVAHLRFFDRFVPPWHGIYYMATDIFERRTITFARAAVFIDHAILACGLERYRLAHGKYPGTLDELVPLHCTDVPHDIMDGKPYRYRVLSEGGYLLYSIGSNGADNGGKIVVVTKPYGETVDSDQGDWVWFGAK